MGLLFSKKSVSLLLSAVYLFTQCLFAHSAESGFWEARSAQRRVEEPKHPLVVASLPAAFRLPEAGPLHSVAPVRPSPHSISVKNHIPGSNSSTGRRLEAWIEAVPPAFGTVRGVFPASNRKQERFVFHIQDVHKNTEAQQNIAKAVEALAGTNKIGLVALEGAFRAIELSAYRRYGHKEILKKAARFSLKTGEISGPVYAALIHPASLPPVIGIDDEFHHEANVDAFREALPLAPKIKDRLAAYEKNLNRKKSMVFNSDLLAFDRFVGSYKKGSLPLGGYLRSLANGSTEITLNLELFLEALALEESLDFAAVERERSQILTGLVQKLDDQKKEELLRQTLAYRLARIGHGKFYNYLERLCLQHGLPVRSYPAMNAYLQYVLLSDSIKSEDLFDEIAQLEEDRYSMLVQTADEKRLVIESKLTDLTEKLLNFTLTDHEWNEYERLVMGMAANRESPTTIGSNIEWNAVQEFNAGFSDLAPFRRFYEEARVRDRKMAENLIEQFELRGISTAILVTGGFHASGIADELEKAGITTINFVPRITALKAGEDMTGLSVFAQEKTPLARLFDGEKLFLAGRPDAGLATEFTLPFHMSALAGRSILADVAPALARRVTNEIAVGNGTVTQKVKWRGRPAAVLLTHEIRNGEIRSMRSRIVGLVPEALTFVLMWVAGTGEISWPVWIVVFGLTAVGVRAAWFSAIFIHGFGHTFVKWTINKLRGRTDPFKWSDVVEGTTWSEFGKGLTPFRSIYLPGVSKPKIVSEERKDRAPWEVRLIAPAGIALNLLALGLAFLVIPDSLTGLLLGSPIVLNLLSALIILNAFFLVTSLGDFEILYTGVPFLRGIGWGYGCGDSGSSSPWGPEDKGLYPEVYARMSRRAAARARWLGPHGEGRTLQVLNPDGTHDVVHEKMAAGQEEPRWWKWFNFNRKGPGESTRIFHEDRFAPAVERAERHKKMRRGERYEEDRHARLTTEGEMTNVDTQPFVHGKSNSAANGDFNKAQIWGQFNGPRFHQKRWRKLFLRIARDPLTPDEFKGDKISTNDSNMAGLYIKVAVTRDTLDPLTTPDDMLISMMRAFRFGFISAFFKDLTDPIPSRKDLFAWASSVLKDIVAYENGEFSWEDLIEKAKASLLRVHPAFSKAPEFDQFVETSLTAYYKNDPARAAQILMEHVDDESTFGKFFKLINQPSRRILICRRQPLYIAWNPDINHWTYNSKADFAIWEIKDHPHYKEGHRIKLFALKSRVDEENAGEIADWDTEKKTLKIYSLKKKDYLPDKDIDGRWEDVSAASAEFELQNVGWDTTEKELMNLPVLTQMLEEEWSRPDSPVVQAAQAFTDKLLRLRKEKGAHYRPRIVCVTFREEQFAIAEWVQKLWKLYFPGIDFVIVNPNDHHMNPDPDNIQMDGDTLVQLFDIGVNSPVTWFAEGLNARMQNEKKREALKLMEAEENQRLLTSLEPLEREKWEREAEEDRRLLESLDSLDRAEREREEKSQRRPPPALSLVMSPGENSDISRAFDEKPSVLPTRYFPQTDGSIGTIWTQMLTQLYLLDFVARSARKDAPMGFPYGLKLTKKDLKGLRQSFRYMAQEELGSVIGVKLNDKGKLQRVATEKRAKLDKLADGIEPYLTEEARATAAAVIILLLTLAITVAPFAFLGDIMASIIGPTGDWGAEIIVIICGVLNYAFYQWFKFMWKLGLRWREKRPMWHRDGNPAIAFLDDNWHGLLFVLYTKLMWAAKAIISPSGVYHESALRRAEGKLAHIIRRGTILFLSVYPNVVSRAVQAALKGINVFIRQALSHVSIFRTGPNVILVGELKEDDLEKINRKGQSEAVSKGSKIVKESYASGGEQRGSEPSADNLNGQNGAPDVQEGNKSELGFKIKAHYHATIFDSQKLAQQNDDDYDNPELVRLITDQAFNAPIRLIAQYIVIEELTRRLAQLVVGFFWPFKWFLGFSRGGTSNSIGATTAAPVAPAPSAWDENRVRLIHKALWLERQPEAATVQRTVHEMKGHTGNGTGHKTEANPAGVGPSPMSGKLRALAQRLGAGRTNLLFTSFMMIVAIHLPEEYMVIRRLLFSLSLIIPFALGGIYLMTKPARGTPPQKKPRTAPAKPSTKAFRPAITEYEEMNLPSPLGALPSLPQLPVAARELPTQPPVADFLAAHKQDVNQQAEPPTEGDKDGAFSDDMLMALVQTQQKRSAGTLSSRDTVFSGERAAAQSPSQEVQGHATITVDDQGRAIQVVETYTDPRRRQAVVDSTDYEYGADGRATGMVFNQTRNGSPTFEMSWARFTQCDDQGRPVVAQGPRMLALISYGEDGLTGVQRLYFGEAGRVPTPGDVERYGIVPDRTTAFRYGDGVSKGSAVGVSQKITVWESGQKTDVRIDNAVVQNEAPEGELPPDPEPAPILPDPGAPLKNTSTVPTAESGPLAPPTYQEPLPPAKEEEEEDDSAPGIDPRDVPEFRLEMPEKPKTDPAAAGSEENPKPAPIKESAPAPLKQESLPKPMVSEEHIQPQESKPAPVPPIKEENGRAPPREDQSSMSTVVTVAAVGAGALYAATQVGMGLLQMRRNRQSNGTSSEIRRGRPVYRTAVLILMGGLLSLCSLFILPFTLLGVIHPTFLLRLLLRSAKRRSAPVSVPSKEVKNGDVVEDRALSTLVTGNTYTVGWETAGLDGRPHPVIGNGYHIIAPGLPNGFKSSLSGVNPESAGLDNGVGSDHKAPPAAEPVLLPEEAPPAAQIVFFDFKGIEVKHYGLSVRIPSAGCSLFDNETNAVFRLFEKGEELLFYWNPETERFEWRVSPDDEPILTARLDRYEGRLIVAPCHPSLAFSYEGLPQPEQWMSVPTDWIYDIEALMGQIPLAKDDATVEVRDGGQTLIVTMEGDDRALQISGTEDVVRLRQGDSLLFRLNKSEGIYECYGDPRDEAPLPLIAWLAEDGRVRITAMPEEGLDVLQLGVGGVSAVVDNLVDVPLDGEALSLVQAATASSSAPAAEDTQESGPSVETGENASNVHRNIVQAPPRNTNTAKTGDGQSTNRVSILTLAAGFFFMIILVVAMAYIGFRLGIINLTDGGLNGLFSQSGNLRSFSLAVLKWAQENPYLLAYWVILAALPVLVRWMVWMIITRVPEEREKASWFVRFLIWGIIEAAILTLGYFMLAWGTSPQRFVVWVGVAAGAFVIGLIINGTITFVRTLRATLKSGDSGSSAPRTGPTRRHFVRATLGLGGGIAASEAINRLAVSAAETTAGRFERFLSNFKPYLWPRSSARAVSPNTAPDERKEVTLPFFDLNPQIEGWDEGTPKEERVGFSNDEISAALRAPRDGTLTVDPDAGFSTTDWEDNGKTIPFNGDDNALLLAFAPTATEVADREKLQNYLDGMHARFKHLYDSGVLRRQAELIQRAGPLMNRVRTYNAKQENDVLGRIRGPLKKGKKGYFLKGNRSLGKPKQGNVVARVHSAHRLTVNMSVPMAYWQTHDFSKMRVWVNVPGRGKCEARVVRRAMRPQLNSSSAFILTLGLESDEEIFVWNQEEDRAVPVGCEIQLPPLLLTDSSKESGRYTALVSKTPQDHGQAALGQRKKFDVNSTGAVGRLEFYEEATAQVNKETSVAGVSSNDRALLDSMAKESQAYVADLNAHLAELRKLINSKASGVAYSEVERFTSDVNEINALMATYKLFETEPEGYGLLDMIHQSEGQAAPRAAAKVAEVHTPQIFATCSVKKQFVLEYGEKRPLMKVGEVVVLRRSNGEETLGVIHGINSQPNDQGEGEDRSNLQNVTIEVNDVPLEEDGTPGLWFADNEIGVRVFFYPGRTHPNDQKELKRLNEKRKAWINNYKARRNYKGTPSVHPVRFDPTPHGQQTQLTHKLRNPDPLPAENRPGASGPRQPVPELVQREQQGDPLGKITVKDPPFLQLSDGDDRRSETDRVLRDEKMDMERIENEVLRGHPDVVQKVLNHLLEKERIEDLIRVHKALVQKFHKEMDLAKLARAHILELIETGAEAAEPDPLNQLIQSGENDAELRKDIEEFSVSILSLPEAAVNPETAVAVRRILECSFWPGHADKLAVARALEEANGTVPNPEGRASAALLIRCAVFADIALTTPRGGGKVQEQGKTSYSTERWDPKAWYRLFNEEDNDKEDRQFLGHSPWSLAAEDPVAYFKGRIGDDLYNSALTNYTLELNRANQGDPKAVSVLSLSAEGMRGDLVFARLNQGGRIKYVKELDNPRALERLLSIGERTGVEKYLDRRKDALQKLRALKGAQARFILARVLASTQDEEVVRQFQSPELGKQLLDDVRRLKHDRASFSSPGALAGMFLVYQKALARLCVSYPREPIYDDRRLLALRGVLEPLGDFELAKLLKNEKEKTADPAELADEQTETQPDRNGEEENGLLSLFNGDEQKTHLLRDLLEEQDVPAPALVSAVREQIARRAARWAIPLVRERSKLSPRRAVFSSAGSPLTDLEHNALGLLNPHTEKVQEKWQKGLETEAHREPFEELRDMALYRYDQILGIEPRDTVKVFELKERRIKWILTGLGIAAGFSWRGMRNERLAEAAKAVSEGTAPVTRRRWAKRIFGWVPKICLWLIMLGAAFVALTPRTDAAVVQTRAVQAALNQTPAFINHPAAVQTTSAGESVSAAHHFYDSSISDEQRTQLLLDLMGRPLSRRIETAFPYTPGLAEHASELANEVRHYGRDRNESNQTVAGALKSLDAAVWSAAMGEESPAPFFAGAAGELFLRDEGTRRVSLTYQFIQGNDVDSALSQAAEALAAMKNDPQRVGVGLVVSNKEILSRIEARFPHAIAQGSLHVVVASGQVRFKQLLAESQKALVSRGSRWADYWKPGTPVRILLPEGMTLSPRFLTPADAAAVSLFRLFFNEEGRSFLVEMDAQRLDRRINISKGRLFGEKA